MTPTVYAVGLALERNPGVAEAIAEAGSDVVAHGWRWIDYAPIPEAEERDHIRRCIEVIARLTGKRPLGWYTGRPSLNTRRLVVEEGGFLYDGDAYADDLPFWTKVAGRDHLIVPHSFDNNDSRMARNQDLAISRSFLPLHARCLRRALSRRCCGAEDDDRQPALPAHRPAGTHRRAAPLHRSCAGP